MLTNYKIFNLILHISSINHNYSDIIYLPIPHCWHIQSANSSIISIIIHLPQFSNHSLHLALSILSLIITNHPPIHPRPIFIPPSSWSIQPLCPPHHLLFHYHHLSFPFVIIIIYPFIIFSWRFRNRNTGDLKRKCEINASGYDGRIQGSEYLCLRGDC